MKSLVSVVMSVYKEKVEWLRGSIESILFQSYPYFEFIIICDNPNYFEGLSILKEYQAKDSRIRVIENKQNIGLTKSLNIGIQTANGEYIARMDADDISLPLRLEKQVSFMEDHPDVLAIGTGITIIDENGKQVNEDSNPLDYQSMIDRLLLVSPIYHPTSFYRRTINGQIVQYDETLRYSQDYALWIDIAVTGYICNLPDHLLFYRVSNSQISHSSYLLQQECAALNVKRAIKKLDLIISPEETEILLSISRTKTNNYTPKEIEDFIVAFYNNNVSNKYIKINNTIDFIVLVYCNYLPLYYPALYSIKRYIITAFRIKRFKIYPLLSLINKFVQKL